MYATAYQPTRGFLRFKLNLRHILVNGKKMTMSAGALYGKIFSANTKGFCKLPIKQASEELGFCDKTVVTAIKTLEDAELIEQVDRDFEGCGYTANPISGKEYVIIPLDLFQATITVDGKTRNLFSSEILVLAYVMRHALPEQLQKRLTGKFLTLDDKKKDLQRAKLVYEKCNNRTLVRVLGLSKKTVNLALSNLCKAGILECEKGKNNHFHSKYTIKDKSIYDYLFVPKKAKKVTSEQAAIEAANARTDRERWYAARKEEAERPAQANLRKMKNCSGWTECVANLGKLEIELAKDEHYNAGRRARVLEAEKARLQEERAYLLRRMGLSEDDITPKYFCAKCEDTGAIKDTGEWCACYKRE